MCFVYTGVALFSLCKRDLLNVRCVPRELFYVLCVPRELLFFVYAFLCSWCIITRFMLWVITRYVLCSMRSSYILLCSYLGVHIHHNVLAYYRFMLCFMFWVTNNMFWVYSRLFLCSGRAQDGLMFCLYTKLVVCSKRTQNMFCCFVNHVTQ